MNDTDTPTETVADIEAEADADELAAEPDREDERLVVAGRLNRVQHELLRRRCLSEKVTIQSVISASVNAYILGHLRVTPTGRYHVSAPGAPLSSDDEVLVRAPTADDPNRVVLLRQPPADPHGGRRDTRWLADFLHPDYGHSVSMQALRLVLRELERDGAIEPRPEGTRVWKFPGGPEDPRVRAVVLARQDGTWDRLVAENLSTIADYEGDEDE